MSRSIFFVSVDIPKCPSSWFFFFLFCVFVGNFEEPIFVPNCVAAVHLNCEFHTPSVDCDN